MIKYLYGWSYATQTFSVRAWLTKNLTDHKPNPPSCVTNKTDKRVTLESVNLILLTPFPGWNKISSNVHIYFVLLLVKRRWSVHVPLEVRCYTNLSRHIKEPQKCIYHFYKKNANFEFWYFVFLPQVTWRVVCIALFAPRCIFLCVRICGERFVAVTVIKGARLTVLAIIQLKL